MKLSLNQRMTTLSLASGLALIVLAAFWPVQYNGFINLDDNVFITENPAVTSGLSWENMKWAFTLGPRETNRTEVYTFHPVTWLSFMLDCDLYGLNPRGHHLTNLILHLLNTLLLFLIFQHATGKSGRSAFVACLFGIHPLHVESVAWATERKDVLSTLFWFLTLWAYIRYVEKPEGKKYLYMVGFFLLGLLSKTMLVTVPFVLLLLDYWPLQRVKTGVEVEPDPPPGENGAPSPGGNAARTPTRQEPFSRLILEKWPLFAISILFSFLAFLDQHLGGAVSSLTTLSLEKRLLNVVIAYGEYIRKMFWPDRLSVFYPLIPEEITPVKAILAAGVLAAISAGVLRGYKRYPYLVTGWFWYLGVLIPVIGLVQIGAQSMADRYTYVSMIGLFLAGTWFLGDLIGSRGKVAERGLVLAAMMTLLLLAFLTRQQVAYWKDSITLYRHGLTVSDKSWLLYNNLGAALLEAKQYQESMKCLEISLRLNPNLAKTYATKGLLLTELGKTEEAVEFYQKALRLDPRNPVVLNNLGLYYVNRQNYEEGIKYYRRALEFGALDPSTNSNLGMVYTLMGRYEEAIGLFNLALSVAPGKADIHCNLGAALLASGRIEESIGHFRKATELDPSLQKAQIGLSRALQIKGRGR